MASVVIIRPAMEAAFCKAVRVTLGHRLADAGQRRSFRHSYIAPPRHTA
jgi:hypothetical protein